VHFLRQVLKSARLAVLVHDFLAQHVDLLLVLLVLCLRLIQAQLLNFARMLLPIELNVVSLIIDSLGLDLFNVVRLLVKFVLHLLNLILENLQLTLFILELLSVNIDFSL